MAIKNILIPEILARFPSVGVRLSDGSNPVVTIPAICPEVGDLEIWDDGDEITIVIKNITHSHFSYFGSDVNYQAHSQVITNDVLHFMQELFSDRILLWIAYNKNAAGWQYLDEDHPTAQPNAHSYLWSGPLKG